MSSGDKTLNGQIRKIIPGESFEAILAYSSYPASDGWTCSVNFAGNHFSTAVACTTNTDGKSFDLAVLAASTKAWGWGPASAQALLTKASPANVKVAEMVCFTVLPDPTVATAEMTALVAIDAIIANRATDDQLTTAIDGIQLQYRSIADLQRLRSYYKRIVNMQIKMMGGKGGTYAIQHIYPENRTIGSPWYGGFPPPVR